MSEGIILEIQREALKSNVNVGGLLRKAKAAAVKLSQHEAIEWMNSELVGYQCKYVDLPKYRQCRGELKARNPYHGLVPIFIGNNEKADLFTRAPIAGGVATLASLLDSEDGLLEYQYSIKMKNAIISQLDIPLEPVLVLSETIIRNVLDTVISLVLDWALELEKNGVFGEGMSFSTSEKEQAKQVTQNIFAQNIGQIGNNSDSASPKVNQIAEGTQLLDQRSLNSFLRQAEQSKSTLPDDVEDQISELLEELRNASDDTARRGHLSSIKSVLEGASGNLTAQGMIQLISGLF